MTHHYDTFPTPFGAFSVATDSTGSVTATAFGGPAHLRQRLPAGDRLQRNPRACAPPRVQLLAYFHGRLQNFDLRLSPRGTDFQRKAWAMLCTVPYGETRTYGRQAAQLGKPRAARAIGRANALNPICVIIPCHRIVGTDGSLTGYAFGEGRKRRLLAHERAVRSPGVQSRAPAA